MNRDNPIFGYEAPVYQALWQRVCTFGAPRLWAAFWTVFCLYVGLLVMVGLGFKWLLIPAIVWMLGHGVLVGLTLWDVNFDDIALAQLRRRYRDYYNAG